MNDFYSQILAKLTTAENDGTYIACDVRELLKVDGVTYLPNGTQWIQ